MFANELSFRQRMMAMLPNNFHGPPIFNGVLVPGLARPYGPRGSLDPLLPAPNFQDPNMVPPEPMANAPINQRKLSPSGAGLLPSLALRGRTSYKTSGWDVLDSNQLPRESKRSRINGPTSVHDPLTTEKCDQYIGGVDQPYTGGPQFVGGLLSRDQVDSALSLSNLGVMKGNVMGCASEDYIWRGVIAKGGNSVCNALCIPLGNGLKCELKVILSYFVYLSHLAWFGKKFSASL